MFLFTISFFFFGRMSCRKIIQPVPYFSTEIEEHQPTEKVESGSDIGLLFCGTDETAAFTDFKEWNRYLTTSLNLDSIDVETIPKGVYTVMVDFKIEEDGSLSEVKITNDPGYGLSNKVSEALNNYKGKWNPVQRSGKNIASSRRQPVTFVFED
jgi:hypothetical protein